MLWAKHILPTTDVSLLRVVHSCNLQKSFISADVSESHAGHLSRAMAISAASSISAYVEEVILF